MSDKTFRFESATWYVKSIHTLFLWKFTPYQRKPKKDQDIKNIQILYGSQNGLTVLEQKDNSQNSLTILISG
jgi:hypothetical protein